MTPPDSGEPHCGDPNCHIPRHTKPDSGEREVCKHGGPGGDCAVCVAEREHRVFISRSLAQCILAALDEERHHYEAVGIRRAARKLEAIAAELRAHMPKEKP